jgi:hypothetical protein
MRRLANTKDTQAEPWSAFTHVERIFLIVACLCCGFVCISTGRLLGIPREPGFNGSLLATGAPVSGIVVLVIAIGICTAIGLFVASVIDVESGLFCCCMGLAALAIRCGAVRPVLQYASGPHVFFVMAIETAVLGGLIVAAWFVLQKLLDPTRRSAGDPLDLIAPNEMADAPTSQKFLTTAVQIVVMGVCELILVQSDAKAQAMAGTGVAAFLGVLAGYMFTPLPKGIWYWIGPVGVGIIGYGMAFIAGGSLAIGDVHGWAAALARPTPLDYAGMGTGGALLGYWCSRRWAQPEDHDEPQEQVAAG